MYTLLRRGGSGGRMLIATFRARTHTRVEGRLSRRFNPRARAEGPINVPQLGPTTPDRGSNSSFHLEAGSAASTDGEDIHVSTDGHRPGGDPRRAFQMTVSNDDSEATMEVERATNPLLPSPALIPVFTTIDFREYVAPSSNLLFRRGLANHSWLQRHALGGFHSVE